MTETADAKREHLEATVVGSLPNSMFCLRLQDGREVRAHVARDLRMAYVRLVAGDVVAIDLSPFDHDKARIRRLLKQQRQKQQPNIPIQRTETSSQRER